MEKKVWGLILSILGVLWLIVADFHFINGDGGLKYINEIFFYGFVGAILFFLGFRILRATSHESS